MIYKSPMIYRHLTIVYSPLKKIMNHVLTFSQNYPENHFGFMVIHGFSRVSLCRYLLVIHEEFPVARLPIECIANADVRALRIWEAELAVAAVANI